MTLNEIVSIYSKSTTPDEYGTISDTRTLIAQAYAKVRPMSGAERNRADQPEDYADYRFYIHYRSDVGPDDIVVWNSVDYNITFVADNGPKEPFMYFDARRGVAA